MLNEAGKADIFDLTTGVNKGRSVSGIDGCLTF